jgi:hypothetical protein
MITTVMLYNFAEFYLQLSLSFFVFNHVGVSLHFTLPLLN